MSPKDVSFKRESGGADGFAVCKQSGMKKLVRLFEEGKKPGYVRSFQEAVELIEHYHGRPTLFRQVQALQAKPSHPLTTYANNLEERRVFEEKAAIDHKQKQSRGY